MEKVEVFTVYSERDDMTFIMEEVIETSTGDTLSTEVKGFYFGEPTEIGTKHFNGKLKATYGLK